MSKSKQSKKDQLLYAVGGKLAGSHLAADWKLQHAFLSNTYIICHTLTSHAPLSHRGLVQFGENVRLELERN